MNAREIVLNIAVNLGRLGKWACEGNIRRVHQFLDETEVFIDQLDKASKSSRFSETFEVFQKSFNELKNDESFDAAWAERVFTWANVLTHRARLSEDK